MDRNIRLIILLMVFISSCTGNNKDSYINEVPVENHEGSALSVSYTSNADWFQSPNQAAGAYVDITADAQAHANYSALQNLQISKGDSVELLVKSTASGELWGGDGAGNLMDKQGSGTGTGRHARSPSRYRGPCAHGRRQAPSPSAHPSFCPPFRGRRASAL